LKILGDYYRDGAQTTIKGTDALISVTSDSFFWVGEPLN